MNVIKVLIADDSPFMRTELTKIMESDPGIKVVGTARDGEEAIQKAKSLEPDVVALDINMPRMDGLTALQHIMIESPRPCVIISSLTQEGAEETFNALDLGAVDYVPKPGGAVSLNIREQKQTIIAKIKGAVNARLSKRAPKRVAVKKDLALPVKEKFFGADRKRSGVVSQKLVVIGVSTGGPKTLFDIIPKLPEDLKAGVLIAQHMPEGFTKTFAQRLNTYSKIQVREATDSEKIEPGVAYLCPGQFHMTVSKAGVTTLHSIVRLSREPNKATYRPCIDILFNSVAELQGKDSIGVILTGMGSDGVDGLGEIKKAGGVTIAEHESTCIIYGMPKGAVIKGIPKYVLPSTEIAEKIVTLVS